MSFQNECVFPVDRDQSFAAKACGRPSFDLQPTESFREGYRSFSADPPSSASQASLTAPHLVGRAAVLLIASSPQAQTESLCLFAVHERPGDRNPSCLLYKHTLHYVCVAGVPTQSRSPTALPLN
jgi:hypothetical protein